MSFIQYFISDAEMEEVFELARELGLVETFIVGQINSIKSAKCGALQTGNDQIFDYVIVIDFESTCWDNKDNQSKWQNLAEIIEFPAVLLNVKTGIIEEQFHHYVMPVENPTLSEFCVKLTGIKQEVVNAGIPLDWDIAMCLQNETKRKQIRKPDVLSQWIDLRLAYRKFYQRKPQGLKGALAEVGVQFTGREHSGIIDAQNTAKLVSRMIKDGYVLSITSSSEISSPQINLKRCPLGNLKNTSTPLSREPQSLKTRTLRSGLHATNSLRNNNKCRLGNTVEGIYNDEKDSCAAKKVMTSDTPKNVTKLASATNVCTPKRQSINKPVSCKRTPPLCRCGRRAACKVANSPGPNQGRSFFTCPNQRRSLGMLSKGCNFFMWC
ncbi:hypothetical protein FOCC_FOCC014424 [Frankliniella occidentalis]|nr:hypothetical protein FOCC_FOCC014424 [Frankliniella occidentalis]